MKRNHRKTRPPIRATTAATTIIVIFVVLERPDDVDVCDGIGAPEVAVLCEMGVVVKPDRKSVVESGRDVVGAVTGAGVWTAAGVEVSANPAWAEKAVWVNAVRPQPRNTVEPELNRYFPTLGVKSGLEH